MQSHIDALIVHCAAQQVLATNKLHVPGERVLKLAYFVDEHFWRPLAPEDMNDDAAATVKQRTMICASGLEFRDYATLLAAVKGMDVDVRIAAASAAMLNNGRFKGSAGFEDLPSNVSVGRYDYAGMRRLYSMARFVVVPLCQRDAPAGLTVILEAMAMGKAVIVSGTRGQTDVVRDPRNGGCGPVVREWWPGFLDEPGVAETLGSLATGLYVTPGDPGELHEAIQYLLDHPEIAEELGHNGQCVARAYFSLDAFARRFSAVIRGKPLPMDHSSLITT